MPLRFTNESSKTGNKIDDADKVINSFLPELVILRYYKQFQWTQYSLHLHDINFNTARFINLGKQHTL